MGLVLAHDLHEVQLKKKPIVLTSYTLQENLHFVIKKMLNRAELHIKRLDLNQRLEEFGNDLLLFTGTFGRFK